LAKIFEFQGYKGSYIDPISGTVGTNINGEFVKTEKGIAWRSDTDGDKVVFNQYNLGTTHSILVECKIKNAFDNNILGDSTIISQFRPTNPSQFRYSTDLTNKIEFSTDFSLNKYYYLLIVREETSVKFYHDNILIGTQTLSSNDDFMFDRLGETYSSSVTFLGEILRVKIWDEALSDTERNNNYEEFLQSRPLSYGNASTKFKLQKPVDLSSEQIDNVENTYTSDFATNGTSKWKINKDNEDSSLKSVDDTMVLEVADAGTNVARPILVFNGYSGVGLGQTIRVEVDYTVESGTPILFGYNVGKGVVSINKTLSGSGTYVIEGEYNESDGGFYLYFNGTNEFKLIFNKVRIFAKSGLVAAYSFDPVKTITKDKALDISGNDNDASFAGNPLPTKDGIKLDGVNDYLIFFEQTLSYQTGFSLMVRFKDNNIDLTTICPLFGNGTSAFSFLELGNGTISLESNTNSDVVNIPYSRDNLEHTYGVNCVNGVVDMYVDGEIIGSGTISDDLTLNQIGRNRFSGYADGVFESVRIHNKPSEISDFKDYHNSFIKPEVLERFEDNAVGDTAPRGWLNNGTGSYEIKEYNIKQGELVANGDFSISDTTGWLFADCEGTIGTYQGRDNVMEVNVTDTLTIYPYQLNIFELGKTYRLKASIYVPDGTNDVRIKTATSGQTIKVINTKDSWVDVDEKFTAFDITGTNSLNFFITSGDVGNKFYLSNISVVETFPLPSITSCTKYLECTSAGTNSFIYGWETGVDASIDYYDGSSWSELSDTLENLISDNAWISLSNNKLTFDLDTWDAITNIQILNWVEK